MCVCFSVFFSVHSSQCDIKEIVRATKRAHSCFDHSLFDREDSISNVHLITRKAGLVRGAVSPTTRYPPSRILGAYSLAISSVTIEKEREIERIFLVRHSLKQIHENVVQSLALIFLL